MSATSTFDEFLRAVSAGRAVVALRAAEADAVPVAAAARRVDGAATARLAGLYTEFAHAWDFPDHFGANKDAFDDCMRDLPGSPLITEIVDANRVLADEPRQLRWFAESLSFYAESYRAALPPVTFAVVLRVPPGGVGAARRRWRNVGTEPVLLGE